MSQLTGWEMSSFEGYIFDKEMYLFPYHIVNETKYCTVFPNLLYLDCIDLHELITVENYTKRAFF